MRPCPEIPPGTPPELLSAACANALRVWTHNATSVVGSVEVRDILFAEALSVARSDMTVDEIVLLLRHMASRIEQGGLGSTTIQ